MLDTKYNHKIVEEGKYDFWLNHDYFKAGDISKKPFTIVIPPPNITGKLHLGHAWDTTLQDIIIRYKKMCGYDTLWLPGMDHAAISTEAKVVAKLKSEGIDKYELGREGFLKEAWAWKDKYSDSIREQWAKLGLALDYSRERFTLDEGLNKAVTYIFVDLYNKGLIYRGERIINWDPVALTALSNEEVIYKDVKGAFYHIKYFIEDTDEYLEVATTRPETLFGDTAVAVNPNDLRYKHLIGKNVILPIVNKKIPIIADEHADMEFGTGIVKITPAHDPNDFEVGNRHNLERIKVINPNGTMNENALEYNGMDRFLAREKLVSDLKDKGLLIKVENIVHSVGHSERTEAMVEPYLSKQWFVSMDKLAKNALKNQENKDEKVNFVPSRFEKIFSHWMSNCHDWCISRQLWWGHRIPAWYKDDQIYVGIDAPKEDGWVQDNDVLDTWFSSGIWPFSTLGWPNKSADMERYFPNDVLVTGYDIIFFWVARMIFQSLEFTSKRPFKDCLIHGLVRDKDGKKMSKSLGNGVDPMDEIDKYGCDSLRYFLATSSAPGQDLRYDQEKVKSTWNFINKLWNASRFCLMNMDNFKEDDYTLDNLKKEDKWILTKLNKTIKSVTKYMEKYEFNNVGSIMYSFIWNDFCDNYIELSKFSSGDNTTKSVLLHVLESILKLMHPFMPYVTEEIYQMLPIKKYESIMISDYPKYNKNMIYIEEEKEIDNLIDFVKMFRNFKAENNITKNFKCMINNQKDYELIKKILKLNDNLIDKSIDITKYEVTNNYYSMIIFYEKELSENDIKLLLSQIDTLNKSIERRKILLSNENYVNKAPKELVEEEKNKLENDLITLKKLLEEKEEYKI